jgi:hypothetical protein
MFVFSNNHSRTRCSVVLEYWTVSGFADAAFSRMPSRARNYTTGLNDEKQRFVHAVLPSRVERLACIVSIACSWT